MTRPSRVLRTTAASLLGLLFNFFCGESKVWTILGDCLLPREGQCVCRAVSAGMNRIIMLLHLARPDQMNVCLVGCAKCAKPEHRIVLTAAF